MGHNYLLLGPETGEKYEFIEQIKSSLDPEAEIYKFYPFDDFEEHFADALGTASLFSQQRFIWLDIPKEYTSSPSITRPNFIRKDLEKTICAYLASQDDDVTFMLSLYETGINKSIDDFFTKAPEHNTKKIYWELKEFEKPGWIKSFFRKNRIRIEEDAVSRILMLVENDTNELKTTCSQLAVFFQMRNMDLITDDDIGTYLTHTRQEDGYSLFNYIARADLDSALECVDTIMRTSNDQMVGVFSVLVWCFRRLNSVLTQISRGSDQYGAFQNAFVLDRPSKISRPNDVTTYKQACLNYTAEDTRQIIAYLSTAEISFREGGSDMQRLRMHKIIFDIITKKGKDSLDLQFPAF